jgi:hypothetical protein
MTDSDTATATYTIEQQPGPTPTESFAIPPEAFYAGAAIAIAAIVGVVIFLIKRPKK